LKRADLNEGCVSRATDITGEAPEQGATSLEGPTMPDGQKYEERLKSSGRDGDNSSPS